MATMFSMACAELADRIVPQLETQVRPNEAPAATVLGAGRVNGIIRCAAKRGRTARRIAPWRARRMARSKRKTVSLCLGSGGARGVAHVGAIHWLTENGYDIRSISGSSI